MSEDNIWREMRQFTPARLGLGRSGASLPTEALLDFELAHAQARDAVQARVNWDAIANLLTQDGQQVVRVASRADSRATYLRRPDLGRRLDEESRTRLSALKTARPPDLVWVVGDGLSAAAINRHAVPFMREAYAMFPVSAAGPLILAENARVALADEIGEILDAKIVVIAIGERPGLSSPDSLGLYVTYSPRVGRTDAERNCLSNIHQSGMSYMVALRKLHVLLGEAKALGCTGTRVKDRTDANGELLIAPT